MFITFIASIHKILSTLTDQCDKINPDQKSNQGRLIGRALFWDTIEAYAKKQSELAWKVLETEEIVETGDLPAGNHELARSPRFTVTCKVSEPRKGFKPEVLMAALKKKYKVPEPASREMIEAAKVPGKGTKTLTIIERGD